MANPDDRLYSKEATLETLFSEYYQRVQTAREFYDLEYGDRLVPPNWRQRLQPLVPPTARWAVDEAVDHILFTPKIRVARRPSNPDRNLIEQEIAENKRRFLAAVWNHLNKNGNVIGDARKTLINEGKVAIYKEIDWSKVPAKPARSDRKAMRRYRDSMKRLGADAFIWRLSILDNLTVKEDPSNHRDPAYLFIKYMMTTEQARAMYPKAGDPVHGEGGAGTTRESEAWRDGGDLDEIEFMEFWSRDIVNEHGELLEEGKFVRWIAGERVHDAVNPYPYIPVAIEDAGFGTIRNGAKIEEKFVGMTMKMQPIFEAEAKQMTAWENVAELTAFGLYMARNRDQSKVYNIGGGEVIDLEGGPDEPTRETFEAVKLPEIPLGVIQLVEKTTSIANDSLKMRTLGGQPLSGVETATEADQQIRNASAKLANPVAACERLVSRLSEWFLMDIDVVLEAPVTVYTAAYGADAEASLTLGPGDLRGFYAVNAELRTTDQEATNMVKARFWAEMYRLIPFLSAWTAMERGEITDEPQKELLRRTSENIFLGERMSLVRELTATQSFGEFASLVQQMATQALGAQAGAGGGAPDPLAGAGGGSQPLPAEDLLGASVPGAAPGSAGAARDVLQGASQIRG